MPKNKKQRIHCQSIGSIGGMRTELNLHIDRLEQLLHIDALHLGALFLADLQLGYLLESRDSNPGPTVASPVVGSPEVQLPKGNGPSMLTNLMSTQ